MRQVGLPHRGHRAEVGVEGVRILPRDLGETGIGKGRIEQAPIAGPTVVHRTPEVRRAPRAEPRVVVRCQVAGVDVAERRFDGPSPCVGHAAARRVAAGAVAGERQVAAALDLRRRRLERRRAWGCLHRQRLAGITQVQRRDHPGACCNQRDEAEQPPQDATPRSRAHRKTALPGTAAGVRHAVRRFMAISRQACLVAWRCTSAPTGWGPGQRHGRCPGPVASQASWQRR